MGDQGSTAGTPPNAPLESPAGWRPPPPWTGPTAPASTTQPPASPFAAPYVPASRGFLIEAPAPRSATPGIVALVAALLAAVGASAVGAVAAFRIGVGTDAADFEAAGSLDNLDFLTPVRDWVLLGEVAFWLGTAFGVWAIVQGIVAIAARRGRVAAIAAVVIAVIGPVVFFVSCVIAVAQGLDAVSGMRV